MKRLVGLATATILFLGLASTPIQAEKEQKTDFEKKLPYMFKEPTWETYKAGDRGPWPLPKAPEYSSGIFSLANGNSIDYKESSNNFFDTASKFKSSGNTEVYYSSNPSSSITMALPEGATVGKSIGGDTTIEFTYANTNVNAYNNTKANNQLVLDSSQGQWLVTNGYFSRDNLGRGIFSSSGLVSASKLDASPWGLMGSSTFVTPEDFLMGLSKAIYGVEESRPMYLQSTPKRLSKKITWSVTNYCPSIVWTYQTTDWSQKDVTQINPAWADLSPPACGETKIMDRGEYLVHPEGYLSNTWYRHYNDQNSFVSANVYELYFMKLLQKGILSTDVAFANATPNADFAPEPKHNTSSFSFNKAFADRYFREYIDYGKNISGSYKYPVWSPELGALYSTPELSNLPLGSNLTDREINITPSGGSDLVQKALGVNYTVSGNSSLGVTSIKSTEGNKGIMSKTTVNLIDALRLIERAMRVEDGDMTVAEAAIITKKYGAQYLDNLSENDKKTVSYLLAKGVLNFENYQEYSNLYSPLSKSFSYKLLYRIANKESRLKFTEITLTDSSDIPVDFSEYRQTVMRADLGKLSEANSISRDGKLIKNGSREKLTLLSDINFKSQAKRIDGTSNGAVGTRYQITAEIDDPLKYLYRSMPLVNVNPDGSPIRTGDSFHVYISKSKHLYNNISEPDSRYVGIKTITYNKTTDRYDVVFLAYGESYQSALTFIKANLETRISSVSDTREEGAIISNKSGRTLSSTSSSEINNSISTNEDLTTNKKYGLTSYSGDSTSIVGNTIVKGQNSVKVGDDTMTTIDTVANMTGTSSFEKIGSQALVTVESDQLNGDSVVVKNQEGKTVGKTTIIEQTVTSKPSTLGKGDIEADIVALNLSLLKTADTLISKEKFTYKDAAKTDRELDGSIVLTWELDLPSKKEQNSLVGSELTPNINDGAKASWIFTEPTNKSLKTMWDYNKGLGDALLATFSGDSKVTMPSGYFTPHVDILIDSVSKKETNMGDKPQYKDLSLTEVNEIENNLIKQISDNLPSYWVKKFVGNVALANYVAGSKTDNKEDILKYIDNSKSEPGYVYINPPGLFEPMQVPIGKTVWAELAFKQPYINDTASTYFNNHAHLPTLATHTIYSTIKGNSFYGEYFKSEGEGITPHLLVPFVKDNFNNIYKNVEVTDYTYHKEKNQLIEKADLYQQTKIGQTVKYKDKEYTVAGNNDFTLELYSNKFMLGTYKDGQIYEATSGDFTLKPILESIHEQNLRTFGRGQEEGIKSEQYMKTYAFNFIPDSSLMDEGVKFIGIKDSTMKPFIYKSVITSNGETRIKLEETTLEEGDNVHVPTFVILSKSTWDITGNQLDWSKMFSGASEELYNKGSLVQILKEQLIDEESKNIVLSQDVKTGTLDIGGSVGIITEDKITFKVPFTANMILGNTINEQEVLDSFNRNADLTITSNNETASATQYLKSKIVGAYDATYKGYHNTLVNNNGQLQVATGTELVNYTDSSIIDSVSLSAIIMDGVRYLNNGILNSDGNYKIHQYQTLKPPAVVSPFTDGAPPLLNADSTIVANTLTRFEAIPTAIELFDSLKAHLHRIALENTWNMIILGIIAISLALSITTLLAHIFAHSPLSNVFFDKVMEVTGIDFLAIISVGTVRISGDFQNSWIRTLKASVMLGVVPLIVFGVMMVYGLI